MSKAIRSNSSNEKLVSERRNRIIRSAIRLFNKKGFDGTSVRDIARNCRMTSANLYNYIGGKEDIIQLIMEEGHRRSQNFIHNAVCGLNRLCQAEALIYSMALFFRHIDEGRAIVTFLYRGIASFQEDVRVSALKMESSETEIFTNIITKGCEEGVFETDDARLIADSIISLGQMWAVKHSIFEKRYTVETYIQLQTANILKQLSASEEKTGGGKRKKRSIPLKKASSPR